MDTSTLEKYRAMLMALDAELRDEQAQAMDDAAPVELDGTFGRLARGAAIQSQQMALEMKRRRSERFLRIKSALQRVEAGTYGKCVHCENDINHDRLEAFPDIVLCVQCASKRKR